MAADTPTPTAADDRFGDWTDDNIVIVRPAGKRRSARAEAAEFEWDPEKHPRGEGGRFGPGVGTVSPDTGGSMTLPDGYDTTRDGLPVLPGTKAREFLMTGPTPQEGTVTGYAKDAFDGYQQQAGTYRQINSNLRSGGRPDEDAVAMTRFIDDLHTVKRDTTVYRAVDAAKFPVTPGMRWTDRGFTSADTQGGGAQEWPVSNRALLAIHVPAGTRAMSSPEPPQGGSATGRELIIQRGSTFEVERSLPQTENPRPRQMGDLFEPGFPGGVFHVNLVAQRDKDAAPDEYVGIPRRAALAARSSAEHTERYTDWDLSNVVVGGAPVGGQASVLGLGRFTE